jgi:multidrug efflux pump
VKVTTYFIKHPVTAIILNCTIILIGLLCLSNLTVREYPKISFPELTVSSTYPNASAEVVESSVTNLLEDKLAGVEGVESIISESSANNSFITIKFYQNFSMDRALIGVREAIGMARSSLPDQVKEPIIERNQKGQGPPFMAACIESDSMSFSELTHYVNLNLKNVFRSIKGVADVKVWGRPYTYRVILDHKQMYNFGINANDVFDAIVKSSSSLPAGKFQKETSVTIISDLQKIEDFQKILVKKAPNPVFLESIARIELGTEDQKFRLKINGKPGLCMGIDKTSDDNPLEVSNLVHQQVKEIQASLPDSIKISLGLDQAAFIRSSLMNIQTSIIEAIFLVLAIVFLFLRNIRATLIPIITIPTSLIGSLLFLKFFGFSINIMTMLAMVLGIGLVVDDAIIVLENITRHLEKGASAFNAAVEGAKEIGFAIVAMTLTLASVYAPIAFVSGMTGQLFIEFAVALAGSVFISGVTAITLSPLMCASLLKNDNQNILPQIDVFLDFLDKFYRRALNIIIKRIKLIFIVTIIAFIGIILFLKLLPNELTPAEDRSLIGVQIPALPGKNIDHTEKNVAQVEQLFKDLPEAASSLIFAQEWSGSVILPLKPIEQRKRSAESIVNSFRPLLTSFPSFDAWIWNWSSGLPGMDDPSGQSEINLVVSTTDSYRNLQEAINKVIQVGEDRKLFTSIHHNLRLDNLGYNVNIDKDILAKLKLSEAHVAKMIEIFFSGNSSLNFKKDGILYPITIEGDMMPWSLDELYLTNSDGKRISIATFAALKDKAEPKKLEHYNQMRSVNLKASLTEGENLAIAMQKLYQLADDILPKSYKKTWVGIAKSYKESSNTMSILFLLALLFIYAILAVQFESFMDPLIILFTVPLACFGALMTLYFTNSSLNIYSQVGLITLIGLITKHGILIVEFANQLRREGLPLLEAIEQASLLRLRPILMTTSAMICGSIPLILSSTAGSEARHAIGKVLVSGLAIGTIFTLFVLPGIYYALYQLKERKL